MKKLVFLIFIGFFILFLSPRNSQALTFTINPSRIELTVPAGSSKSLTVYADNTKSDTPLHVRVFLEDIAHLPDGTNDYLALGSTPWSFTDWISVKPTEFELPAGKFQGIRFTISVPADAKGGRYGVVFFEGAPPLAGKPGTISAILCLGTIVSINVAKTEVYKAKLTEISAQKTEKGELEIVVKLFNEGNVLFRPTGEVKVKDSQGKQISKMELNSERGGVLPGATRVFKVKYEKPLEQGTYNIEATIDYGGDVLIGGRKEMSF